MEDIKDILSSASFYKQGYFYNDKMPILPESVKQELKIANVLLAEKIRGIATIGFYKDTGDLFVEVRNQEDDFSYDEINAKLEVARVEKEHAELFNSLTRRYKTFVMGKVTE